MIGLDRRLISNFDWVLLVLTLLLAGTGLVNLYSATSDSGVYLRQLYWILVGLGGMLVVVAIPYNRLDSAAYIIYGINVLLLAAVLVSGKVVGGSQRWLVFGPVRLQPSELMKVSLVLAMARYCRRKESLGPFGLRDLVVPLLIMGLPAALIMKQPDLGTALLLLAVGGSMLLFNGIRFRTLAFLGGGALLAVPLIWRFLQPYQQQRVLTFLNPEGDPLGSGYHVIQSKIAVGSGGLWGKGYTAGTQTQLNFIPEHHTDFAFSVLAEEWGFIGGVVVVSLFALIFIWGLNISYHAKDRFARLASLGMLTIFFWQMLVNIGMVTGMLPVVGIPLPFISYGGSSAVVNMLALGLLMNVSMRRFVFTR